MFNLPGRQAGELGVLEGERPSTRSLVGRGIAVAGVIALALAR